MSMEIKSVKAVYGETYKKGYIGFTYHNTNILSMGIAYVERWERMSDIKVSHALIVTGENKCVEAHMKDGVQESHLDTYFDNPHYQIYFRKPVSLIGDENDPIAKDIVERANTQIGTKYDIALIAAQALQGNFIGKLINTVFHSSPDKFVSKLLNKDDRWICSELAAYCLDSHYAGVGILNNPVDTIDPQELFEDQKIFEPWTNKATSNKG